MQQKLTKKLRNNLKITKITVEMNKKSKKMNF